MSVHLESAYIIALPSLSERCFPIFVLSFCSEMSLIMEEGLRQEWRCDRDYYSCPTSFINTSCCFNDGDLGFGSNACDLLSWNDLMFDGVEFLFSPSRSEAPASVAEDSKQVFGIPMSPKMDLVSDDLIFDCPSGGEDLRVYDEMFSDFSSAHSESPCSTTVEFCSMEEDLMDVILNECEGVRMEACVESHELCEDGRDVVSVDERCSEGLKMEACMESHEFCEDDRDVVNASQQCSEGLCQDWSEGNKSISSEAVNTSGSVDFDWAGLIPCNTDSAEYRGLRLIHLLTACADAISEGAHDLAEIILARLGELVSPIGSAMERVAYYLSQSLHQHHSHQSSVRSSNNRTKDPNYLGALSLLNQAYPYIRFAHFTANQSILEAITAHGQKVHIIDFDIMEGMQWPPLMETLKSENCNIAHLRITALRWDDDDDNEGDDSGWPKDTGRRLSEYASSLGIPFSFQETQLENLKRMLDCKEEDEIVIVNCMWGLPHMLQRGRKKLLEFIHGAQDLNPAILTMGTGPNSMADHEKLNFSERFAQCLNNLCAVLDSVEAGLPAQYALARAMVERFFMAPLTCRPITYLSEEKVGDVPLPSGIDSVLQLGFAESDMSSKNILYAKYMVKDQNEYRVEMAGTNQLLLLWQSTPLTWVSTWQQSRPPS
ncbi:hypothetical protein SUGI_0130140 [Cryptomeria japonica]|nr:hypothetical protein SUGI_0130140 [Cryptomeria japonica]